MSCTSSARAGGRLFSTVASQTTRTLIRSPVKRVAGGCGHQNQRRALSLSARRWQQLPASQTATAPSPPRQPPPRPAPPTAAAVNTAKVQHDLLPSSESEPLRSLTDGLQDPPPVLSESEKQVDWTRSYHGLSSVPFTGEQSAILQQEIKFDDIEIKPDGIIYLPEIKHRRILNKAFRPGGWGLAPRGETIVTGKTVTREYALVAGGRLISIARGEQQYFDPDGIPTATEGCKSNALMRCCKDLGIASELWDPRFIRKFLAACGREMVVEHVTTKKRRKHWMRKDDELKYPFKEVPQQGQGVGGGSAPQQQAQQSQFRR
ncbi:hypothetical protein LTR53_005375 [Teratosphaeriaceae sp. CCFEE 6253]|nr:hypothetical protein LTR53_005375 [Teratosphaeriaceae sp. CCFEE 6253]